MTDRDRPLELTRADALDGAIGPLLSALPTIAGFAVLAPWLVPIQIVVAARSSALVRRRLEDIEAELHRLRSERPELGKHLSEVDAVVGEVDRLRAELADVRIGAGGTADIESRLLALEQREAARLDSFRIGMSAVAHGSFANDDEIRRACARFAGNVFAGAPGDQATLAAVGVLPSLSVEALAFVQNFPESVVDREDTAYVEVGQFDPEQVFKQAGVLGSVRLLEAMRAVSLIDFGWGGGSPMRTPVRKPLSEYRVSLTSVGRAVRLLTK